MASDREALTGGMSKRAMTPAQVAERFMARVDQSGDCWEWTARKFWDGYGMFYVARKTVRAHRWSYEHYVGPIPDGLVIDHLCRNRACVRPDHLEPVTVRENVLRGEGPSARAARAIECPHGHPYDEANTRVNPDGSRACRACHRVQQTRARRAQTHHFTDDQLAQHDAEVREATKAGIAEAIEGLATRGPDNGARHPNTMRTIAARIARTWKPTP